MHEKCTSSTPVEIAYPHKYETGSWLIVKKLEKVIFLFVLCCASSLGFSDIAHAATILDGCPNTWKAQMPNLELRSNKFSISITPDKKLIGSPNSVNRDDISYQYFTSSYGQIWKKNAAGSAILKTNWNWLMPDVAKTIASLDKQALFTGEYQRSNYADFRQLVSRSFENLDFPMTSGGLRSWFDVSNGTWIRAALTVMTANCPKSFTFYSNSIQLNNLDEEPINIERYLKYLEVKSNFAVVNAARTFLNSIPQIFSKSRIESDNQQILVNKLGVDSPGGGFEVLAVGLNPGCAVALNPNSSPPYGASFIQYKSFPCVLGIMAGLGKLESFMPTPCSSQPAKGYDCEITNSAQALNGEGSYIGEPLIVMVSRVNSQKPSVATNPNNEKKILCIKGKLTKTVSGPSPVCPKGYKIKK